MVLRIVARRFGWLPGHSGGHQGVAMQLLWCSMWSLRFCAIKHIAMWVPGCCSVVAKALGVVFKHATM